MNTIVVAVGLVFPRNSDFFRTKKSLRRTPLPATVLAGTLDACSNGTLQQEVLEANTAASHAHFSGSHGSVPVFFVFSLP